MKLFKKFKRNKQTSSEAPAAFKAGRAGALLAARPKRTLFAVLAAALCCLCLAVTGIGLSFLNANASATGSDLIILESNGMLYKSGLKALYRRLGSTSSSNIVTTYSALSSNMGSYDYDSSTLRTRNYYGGGNSGYNIQVRFGGYDWLVGYLSKVDRTTDGTSSANGHVIITLVLADSTGSIKWANHTNGGKSYSYPASMYSSSYVRSYLTGSKYASSGNSTPSSTYGTSIWQTFTNNYKSYLIQPKYVSWQETEDAKTLSDFAASCPNDSYSTTNSFNLLANYNFLSKTGYGDWKNDYIWLPSGAELDSYQTQTGLFGADDNFISATSAYWLRSGRCKNSLTMAYTVGASGSKSSAAKSVTAAYAIRPAIHLDLYALDKRTSSITNAPATYWTSSQANYYRYSNNILYGSYTGVAQTATLYEPKEVTSPNTDFFSSTYSGTTRTVTPSSANVTIDTSASSYGESHDYKYLYYYPGSGYFWSDGTKTAQYYSIKLFRAVLSIGFNSTSFTYTGGARGPTISSISAKSAAASKVNKTVGSSYLPAASSFSLTYYGTTAAGKNYPLSSTAPTEVGSYYVRVVLANTNNYRTNFTLNEAYAAPNNATSTNTYQRDYAFTITYGDITTASVTPYNATYDGKAQKLITGYSATVKTTPQWTFSTTSSSSGFSSTVPTATNAGTYTVWCQVSAPYYNTRVFITTATIGKKNLTISWNPSGTGAASYTYNGGGQGPTASFIGLVGGQNYSPTVYYNGSTTKPTNVGSYNASVNNTAPTSNYTVAASSKPFTINKANITSVSVSPYNGTYDGTAHNAVNSYSATTKGNQGKTWYWGTSSNPTSTTVPKLTNYTSGTRIYYKITAPNHNDYTGSVVAKVNKKNLTVVWNPSGTASYTYNGSPQGPTATYSGLISGQNYSPTVYYNGSTTKPTNAGSYTASVNNTAPTSNYTVTASTKSFTINGMAITSVSVTPYSGVYDGVAHAAATAHSAATVGGESATWYWGTSSNPTSTTIPKVTNATTGTTIYYKITAPNHSDYNGSVKYTIARRDLSKTTNTYSEISAFTFSGNENKPTPTVTKVGDVNVTSTGMFSYSYANNVNAGTATVTVTGLASGNYTGSYDLTFTIEKAVITGVEWDKTQFTYNGSEQCPALSKINTATNVISSAKPLNMFEVTGGQVNAGLGYTATATLVKTDNFDVVCNVGGTDGSDTRFFKEFAISPFGIEIEWSDGQLIYDGTPKTATPSVKTALPANGENAGLETVAWLCGGVKLDGKPVNAGDYTAVAKITSTNYVIVEGGVKLLDGSKHNFKIVPRTVSAEVSGDTVWQYTGIARAPQVKLTFSGSEITTAYGFVFRADGKENWSDAAPIFGKYSAKLILEDKNLQTDGDFIIPCEVTKRVISVTSWSGDSLSRKIAGDSGEVITYVFDGKAHNITPYAELGADDEVYWNGEKVTKILLTVKNTNGEKTAGLHTAEAVLDKDMRGGVDFNGYFELETESKYMQFEILPFKADEVRWYKYENGYTNANFDEDECVKSELDYQYTELYGAAGPNLSAIAFGSFIGDNGEKVTIKIPLHITYNVSPSGYWTAGKSYEARAEFADAANCSFDLAKVETQVINGTNKCVKAFAVTGRNLDVEKVTVVWKVYVAGVAVDIRDERFKELTQDDLAVGGSCGWVDGVFTFVYDGKAHYPVPTGAEGMALAENCKNKVNAGNYTAYIKPTGDFAVEGDAEIPFKIVPVNLTLEWNGDNDFVFDGAEHHPTVKWISGTRFDDCRFAYTSEVDAGTYACTVSVVDESGKANKNYKITSTKTCSYTIAKKQISADLVEWSGNNGEFVWEFDGKVHCPEIKPLTVTLKSADGDVDYTVPVTVAGGASAIGKHFASAYIDDKNFEFIDSDGQRLDFVERGYEISQNTIVSVVWENLSFTYEEGVSRIPTAYGKMSDGTKVDLNVWGKQIDAGTYTAYVTDDYAFADGVETSHTFTISPKTIDVIWTDKFGYEVTESTAAENLTWVYDGNAHSPAVTVGIAASNYTVTSFTDAGSYTAEIVFTNPNYTCAADDINCGFTIAKKQVEITWTASGWTENKDGVYYWRYDGTEGWKPQYTAGAIAEWSDTHKQNLTDYVTVYGLVGNVGTYKALAVLDEDMSANFTLTNCEKEYVVLPYEVEVKWIGNTDEADANFGEFVWAYDGTYHAPTAVYTLWDGTEVTVDKDGVIGARVNAGEYVASIELPENCTFATYKSGENIGASCGNQAFTIGKKTVDSLIWRGDESSKTVDGVIVWEYDGVPHCLVATVDGTGAELLVTGARINANGTAYTATAALKDGLNYEFGKDVNSTCSFKINEKQVYLVWSGDEKSTLNGRVITWSYTGSYVCPEAVLAVLEDGELKPVLADGTPVSVIVTGGKTSVGSYTATALDTFTNYAFADGAAVTQPFEITAQSLDEYFAWKDKTATVIDGVYNYVFNGNAQRPFATLSENKNVKFAYSFYRIDAATLSEGETVKTPVGSIIDVGTYEVVVTLSDPNYTVTEKTVTVVIKPLEVDAVWSDKELVENGSAQAPSAYFVDVYGQAVALSVAGGVVSGSGTATVEEEQGNYIIKNVTCAFTVKERTSKDYEWDWAADGDKWKKASE